MLPMRITGKNPWTIPFLPSSRFPNLCPNLKPFISGSFENNDQHKETIYSPQRKDRSVFPWVICHISTHTLLQSPPRQTPLKPSTLKELRLRPTSLYPAWSEERTRKIHPKLTFTPTKFSDDGDVDPSCDGGLT